MLSEAIGLDIGGANLKAATASGWATTRPFELWKYPERLADELTALTAELPKSGPVAVTMTGELCDCFATKLDGVRHILAAVVRAFGPARVRVWSTSGEFLTARDAEQRYLKVAAANWHALATFACRFAPAATALLLDTGSTTTDVIPLANGHPVPAGRTDPERLRTGELVYTGTRRTPVCAILGAEVVAEVFATALDVYLRLGLIPEEPDNFSTADGRPATKSFAHARLSRMLGGDPELISEPETDRLAHRAYMRQREMLVSAMQRVAKRLSSFPNTLVVAGSGEHLAEAAATEFLAKHGNQTEMPQIVSLTKVAGAPVSHAACAYALAVLAAEADK
ncbi:MAG TPA: hydantoinase/oxoprolinase family protein [Gemmataceae bacterium]|nr:hydantoinase/oxoprolinase family protein [Gemmataceae bacterium]